MQKPNFDTNFIVKQGPFVNDTRNICVISVYVLLELTDEIIYQGKKCGGELPRPKGRGFQLIPCGI
jgi:hypothetical protein